MKDKDAGMFSDMLHLLCSSCPIAKSQLTKANQTKTKMENLARELQKVRTPPLTLVHFLSNHTPRITRSYGCVRLVLTLKYGVFIGLIATGR